jgi:hypothetical protein
MATIKDILVYWKPIVSSIVGGAVFIITSTIAIANWTESQIQNQVQLSEAKSALAHDFFFQQSRLEIIDVKIQERQRELKRLMESIGDREPNAREKREIEYLDNEIQSLRDQKKEIKEKLADAHK